MNKVSQPLVFRFESMVVGVLLLALAPAIRSQAPLDSTSAADPTLIPIAAPQTPSSTAAPQVQTPVASTATQTQTQSGTPTTTQITGRACDLVSSPFTCLDDVLHDQKGIWTAPARLRGRKLLWLVPFATATSLAFLYDVRAMNALGPSPVRIRVSNDFAHLGSGFTLVPAAGLAYLIGKLDHKERPRETGVLALESLADAGLVVEALKLATDRQRPYLPPGKGQFWPEGVYSFSSSFPSGHAAASFALARVVVEETPGHPWLHVALYGLATGVAIARVTGENHFPSDALVGSVIGYSVGGYVYQHHSAFYSPKAKSVRIEPLYNPMTASYGVTVSLTP